MENLSMKELEMKAKSYEMMFSNMNSKQILEMPLEEFRQKQNIISIYRRKTIENKMIKSDILIIMAYIFIISSVIINIIK